MYIVPFIEYDLVGDHTLDLRDWQSKLNHYRQKTDVAKTLIHKGLLGAEELEKNIAKERKQKEE